ncbi:energy coupling factor transporter S component ThiW [Staphylococcus aureus]
MKSRKLAITALLIAINVVLSSIIIIPLGPVKAAPVQHFVNVLSAVIVGPWYGLAQALISSILRVLFGTGTAFAFPGSMIGVLLASMFYIYRKHIFMAAVGEVLGTGVIGSLICIPLASPWASSLVSTVDDFLFIIFSSAIQLYSYFLSHCLKKHGLLGRELNHYEYDFKQSHCSILILNALT